MIGRTARNEISEIQADRNCLAPRSARGVGDEESEKCKVKSEKFKDVSIDTLPFTKCIPAHWRIVPLKYSMDILDYLREPITAGQRPQSNPIYDYYGASGVIDKIDFYNVEDKVLLIGEDGANLVLRNLPLVYKASGRFWVNNHAHILKPKFDDYDFMAYQLEAMDYYLYITGAAQPKLSQENLRKVRLLQPPLVEQRAIVAYLDEKCGKVDRLVAAKEKEAALLKELKQSMIAEAVCGKVKVKGEGEQRKMKPSGIQWLSEVPEGWEVKTLRQFLKMVSRKGFPDKQLLSVTRENGVVVRNVESKEENHNFIPEDLSKYKLVEVGDFAINKMKSWQGSYGVSEFEGIVSPAYYICKLSGVDKNFFSVAIRSKPYVSFFARFSKGIRVDQWDLSPIALKEIPFLLPPLAEQREIVAHIEARAAKIDAAVKGLEREVAALKEYKQRLIADVVTGQRKVA